MFVGKGEGEDAFERGRVRANTDPRATKHATFPNMTYLKHERIFVFFKLNEELIYFGLCLTKM